LNQNKKYDITFTEQTQKIKQTKEEKMYKLVAIDLDGTMLNSYGMVTENTKQVIKNTINKGTEVIIASGRPIDSIKTIAKEIGSENYFIAGNGALIYDIKKDEIIYEKFMNKQKVLEIIKICEENSISYNIYTEKTIIAKGLKYNVLYYYKENLKKEENKKTNITIVEDVYEYIKNLENEKFLKITVCDETKSVFNSIIRKLRTVEDIDVLDVLHMSRKMIKQGTEDVPIEYYYTEISLKDVDKWNAIEYLANKMNISKDEIIAIGDNINDKEMIENAKVGIAMGQSTPVITEIADFVTSNNNEDGVAKALEKYC
jgi:Cof subfamily protein (haloacid dehalogenase superfamily)